MANKHRGETDIVLLGKTHTVRLTFAALCELEDMVGKTAWELLQEFARQKASTRVITSIIYCGIRGMYPEDKSDCPSWNELGEIAYRHGLTDKDLLLSITECLLFAVGGDAGVKALSEEEKTKKPKAKAKAKGTAKT